MDREFDIYRIPLLNGQGKFNNFNVSFASTNQGSTDRLVRGPRRSANKKIPWSAFGTVRLSIFFLTPRSAWSANH